MTDEPSEFLLQIEGREYDATDLTLGEVEQIEEACGSVPLYELNLGLAKVLRQIAYVMLKRNDPDVSMDNIKAIRYRSLLEPAGNGAATVADRD